MNKQENLTPMNRRFFAAGFTASLIEATHSRSMYAQNSSPEPVEVVTIGGNSSTSPTPTEVTPTPVSSSQQTNVNTAEVNTIGGPSQSHEPVNPEPTSTPDFEPEESNENGIETAEVEVIGSSDSSSQSSVKVETSTPSNPENTQLESEPQLKFPEKFVQTAEDIKAAYDYANSGYTSDFPGLSQLLKQKLLELGYSEERINTFEVRRKRSLVESGEYGMATQCLGWVGTVTALWTGMSTPEKTLNTFQTAGEVNDVYANGTPLPIGNWTYKAVGNGNGFDIKRGDIAVSGTAFNGDHIGIVYDVTEGDPNTMVMIESNGNLDCKVTNDRISSKAGYTFYRLVQE